MRRGIILYLEYHRPNWVRPPPLPQESVSPPEPKGGKHSPAGEGGRTQFRRLERKPGPLSTLWLNGSVISMEKAWVCERIALIFSVLQKPNKDLPLCFRCYYWNSRFLCGLWKGFYQDRKLYWSWNNEPIGSVPIPTFMCLWAIHTFPGSVNIFPAEKTARSIESLYKLLRDRWMWKFGLWARNSFSGNICFEFLVMILCSVVHQCTAKTKCRKFETNIPR